MTITDGELHGMIDHWYHEHEHDVDPDGWIADVTDWRNQISDGESTQDMAVSLGFGVRLLGLVLLLVAVGSPVGWVLLGIGVAL